jgi:hypothetical protein
MFASPFGAGFRPSVSRALANDWQTIAANTDNHPQNYLGQHGYKSAAISMVWQALSNMDVQRQNRLFWFPKPQVACSNHAGDAEKWAEGEAAAESG